MWILKMAENPQKIGVECLHALRSKLVVGLPSENPSKNRSNKSVQKLRPKNPSRYPCHFVIAIVPIGFVSARPMKTSHQASTYSWARWPCYMQGACKSTFTAGRIRSKQKIDLNPSSFVSAKMPA